MLTKTTRRKEVQMQTITKPNQRDISKMLAEFWMPHLEACEDLFAHLEHADRSIKEIRADALKYELESYDEILARQVPGNWRFKEYRRRTIITLAGKITYMRRIYTEPSGICHALLDEVLGIRTRRRLAPDAFLWIVKMASDISFRKTARAFFERTGAKISHWLVMEVIREEGALILEELYDELTSSKASTPNKPLRWSSDVLFAEYDGIHIPLQKPTHETRHPRWVYEQNRHKTSFELKVACAYQGKDDKGRRGGCIHFVSDEAPTYFWPLFSARVRQTYVPEDIFTIYASSDAAGWCKKHGLSELAPAAEVSSHLDAYHVNREIRRTFKANRAASYIIGLVYAKRTKRLFSVLEKVISHAKKGKEKDRYCYLRGYLKSNVSLIECGLNPSMGTMEGTNAHVYAARLKVWGGAWSRKGALAMALVRAHIASGEELIAPKLDNVMLTDVQQKRRRRYEESQLSGKWHLSETEGFGYEPPQGSIVLTTRMAPEMYGWIYYS
jgi:hypothetical protein